MKAPIFPYSVFYIVDLIIHIACLREEKGWLRKAEINFGRKFFSGPVKY